MQGVPARLSLEVDRLDGLPELHVATLQAVALLWVGYAVVDGVLEGVVVVVAFDGKKSNILHPVGEGHAVGGKDQSAVAELSVRDHKRMARHIVGDLQGGDVVATHPKTVPNDVRIVRY